MNPEKPHTLPPSKRTGQSLRGKLILGLALPPAALVGLLTLLRLLGLIHPFYVPNQSMTPAISAGDHVMMEGLTFLSRKPHRGDIVVFNTDGIDLLPSNTIYVMRVAGEPGDHLRISSGSLYINDKLVVLGNIAGEISYNLPSGMEASAPYTDMIIPKGDYFVLGDNSTNSRDSRFFGTVPRKNITGRIVLCYWPPQRIGRVK